MSASQTQLMGHQFAISGENCELFKGGAMISISAVLAHAQCVFLKEEIPSIDPFFALVQSRGRDSGTPK